MEEAIAEPIPLRPFIRQIADLQVLNYWWREIASEAENERVPRGETPVISRFSHLAVDKCTAPRATVPLLFRFLLVTFSPPALSR